LPLTLKWANEAGVSLLQALACVTSVPARLLGLPVDRLDVGSRADLCIYDPSSRWRVDSTRLRSQGHNTPFSGHELEGKVLYTIMGGHIVYE
jgi:dihydroorotase